jgi:hypothetical protein
VDPFGEALTPAEQAQAGGDVHQHAVGGLQADGRCELQQPARDLLERLALLHGVVLDDPQVGQQ